MTSRAWVAVAFLTGTTVVFGSAWWVLASGYQPWRIVDPGPLPAAAGVCRANADCPLLQSCAINRDGRLACIPDECTSDRECEAGHACLITGSIAGERGPRRCVLVGEREEGERCEDDPGSVHKACKAGLWCNSLFCGRPCRPGDKANCPEGFSCQEGFNGSSCVPSCEGRGCPEGQSCIRFHGGTNLSMCAAVFGDNCQSHPCPVGKRCHSVYTSSSDKVAMGCLTPCGGGEGCPEGFVCDDEGFCGRQCSPAGPPCDPGMECLLQGRGRGLRVCQLNPPRY